MAELGVDKRDGGLATAEHRTRARDDRRNQVRLASTNGVATHAPEVTRAVESDHTPADSLRPSVTRRRLMVADAAASVALAAIAIRFALWLQPMDSATLSRHLLLTVASLPAFALGAVTSQMYRARANDSTAREFRNITKTVLVGTIFMICLAFAPRWTTSHASGSASSPRRRWSHSPSSVPSPDASSIASGPPAGCGAAS